MPPPEAGRAARLDIVTVPDFSTPEKSVVFALRTLFFLASWQERVESVAGRGQLHLACIGEPPLCVREMASRSGALVHVFVPFRLGRSLSVNKLRAFEIPENLRIGARFFLVDTDSIWVREPFTLLSELSPDHLAAAPEDFKWVPEDYWQLIYRELVLRDSGERMALVSAQLGLFNEPLVQGRGRSRTDVRLLRPYYNGGMIVCPWQAPLGELWPQHLRAIYDLFSPSDSHAGRLLTWIRTRRLKARAIVSTSDMAGLSTAIQMLREQGWGFHWLPDALNVRKTHLRAGAFNLSNTALLHATGFLRGLTALEQAPEAVSEYGRALDEMMASGAERRGATGSRESFGAQSWLEKLWRERVEPCLAVENSSLSS